MHARTLVCSLHDKTQLCCSGCMTVQDLGSNAAISDRRLVADVNAEEIPSSNCSSRSKKILMLRKQLRIRKSGA